MYSGGPDFLIDQLLNKYLQIIMHETSLKNIYEDMSNQKTNKVVEYENLQEQQKLILQKNSHLI